MSRQDPAADRPGTNSPLFLALAVGFALAGLAVAFVASDPGALLQAVMRQERGAASLTEHTMTWGEHTIVYLDGGDPRGAPVVLLHGFSADKDNWTRMAKTLGPAGYRIIAPDLPGHGLSSRIPSHTYGIESQVAFVEHLRAELGLETMHLGGNSMGGHISALYGARHPERVRSLALLNPGGVTSPVPSERNRILEETGENPLLVTSVEDYDRLLAFVFHTPPTLPTAVKQYFADRAVATRDFNDKIHDDIKGDGYVALEPLLPSVQAETLVLWGDTDRVLHPSGAEVFGELLPRAEVVMMKDMGHAPMIERPAETAGILIDFFSRVDEDLEIEAQAE